MPSRDASLPAEVLQAVQRVWFAGLGAMALAQDEGSRLAGGTASLFSLLVEKGQEMERAGLSPARGVTGAVSAADQAWTRIQHVIDAQVTAALQRLGVPTREEIADLNRRIDRLTASIESLEPRS
jgi:poly(hydroxyalkanoate) granule-associated protein